MKYILVLLISILGLSACSVSGLEESDPSISQYTYRSSDDYTMCLADRWLDYNSTTKIVKTQTGNKVMVMGPAANVMFLAVISAKENSQTLVKVYNQWLMIGGGKFLDAAKSCL